MLQDLAVAEKPSSLPSERLAYSRVQDLDKKRRKPAAS
jgi:hypothetical protein